MGETEATCNSYTETTATTAGSQDAALSSIEGSVNCSSSERCTKLVTRAFFPGPKAREKRPGDEVERCTPLSGIGKRLNHGRASEASRATSDILQQHDVEMNWKLLQLCQLLDLQVSLVHQAWLHLLYGTDVQVSTTPYVHVSPLQYILLPILWY